VISSEPEQAQRFYPSETPGDSGVKVYVRVQDLDAYLARAAELGGAALVPPMDLPGGYGRIAIFADCDGNAVGLWS
jgi:predicted enzyme related to lactoylglutathione lyase